MQITECGLNAELIAEEKIDKEKLIHKIMISMLKSSYAKFINILVEKKFFFPGMVSWMSYVELSQEFFSCEKQNDKVTLKCFLISKKNYVNEQKLSLF